MDFLLSLVVKGIMSKCTLHTPLAEGIQFLSILTVI